MSGTCPQKGSRQLPDLSSQWYNSRQRVRCWLHLLPLQERELKLRGGNNSQPQPSQLEEWLGELLGGAGGNKELARVQRRQKMERTQTIRAALMRTYSGIALHAPKEQLLTCVDKDIMGNILRLSRDKQRDLQLKLALVQSIAEVSCAIQAVGDCGSFELSLKQEATRTLLDWIKREPWDSLVYGVFQALEELSKLRPPLSGKENRNLLAVCCQSVLSHPSEERTKKGRKSVRAAVNMEVPTGQCLPTSGSGSHLSTPWQPP
ncbi:maestro heat-like repeat-containing protein family member 2B [Morphnus guianensis]